MSECETAVCGLRDDEGGAGERMPDMRACPVCALCESAVSELPVDWGRLASFRAALYSALRVTHAADAKYPPPGAPNARWKSIPPGDHIRKARGHLRRWHEEDAETGQLHLAHALMRLIMALELELDRR